MSDVFLLSPAFCGGRRAKALLKDESRVGLAERLHAGTLTIGEAFAFFSGLYFRGKLTYARASAAESFVITPTRGLLPLDTIVTADDIREFASVDVSTDNPRYRVPLTRDVTHLAARLSSDARVVLLGSIASDKYVLLLHEALGERLHYPIDFIGRGDMSRGGLLLRHASAGTTLEYRRYDATSNRRGPRPP